MVVFVYMNKCLFSMLYEFLDYIKECGWFIDDKENYVIDMEGWNFNDFIVILLF